MSSTSPARGSHALVGRAQAPSPRPYLEVVAEFREQLAAGLIERPERLEDRRSVQNRANVRRLYRIREELAAMFPEEAAGYYAEERRRRSRARAFYWSRRRLALAHPEEYARLAEQAREQAS